MTPTGRKRGLEGATGFLRDPLFFAIGDHYAGQPRLYKLSASSVRELSRSTTKRQLTGRPSKALARSTDGSCVSTYMRFFCSVRSRLGSVLLLGVWLAAGCDGQARAPASGDDPLAGSLPSLGADGVSTLRAAPFQSSAITLIGGSAGQIRAWTFERFTAVLQMRASVPVGLEVTIETGSAATSDPSLKARLADATLLNPGLHPRATFRTSELREISRVGDAVTYAASGVLSLAGRTHAVTIPLELTRTADGPTIQIATGVGRAGWRAAFSASETGVFDDQLQLRGRLVFPASDRR
jgi:polyisoprenoid-binding protein YceI